jgi:3-oxosteroid 1-dehydrogenase
MADRSYDFVIVGSGGGGLAATIKAKLLGLRALLVEKTPYIGGSSILSGGVIWMPNNPVMRRAGVKDSREAALQYMANFVGPDELYSTPARREAFVDTVDEFIDTMEGQGMQYRYCPNYSDYYEHLPGGMAMGRSLEAELFDWNRLGEWKSRTRPPTFPGPVRLTEARPLSLVGVSGKSKMLAAEVGWRFLSGKLTGKAVNGCGGSLQGRMLEIALKLGCEIWTEAGMVGLDIANGRVEGVHLRHHGLPETVRATRGVLVCTGGFTRNTEMREKYHRHPISDAWTFANPGDTGEAIQIMEQAGAGLGTTEAVWWNIAWRPEGAPQRIAISESNKPFGIMVDSAGQRFVNETDTYMAVGDAIYARHATTPNIPCWLVMDIRHRKRYTFSFQPPGDVPKDWLKRGWAYQDTTLAGLARQCGIDPAGLEATVGRYNAMCETGVDEDFGRGANAYHRYFGDPSVTPNPTMGPIAQSPFWAVAIWPGDVGTSGGVLANERAQVMRPDGSVIDGLYAAGNCTASFCGPYYVGAGQSIGASSVFGYIAAKEAAAS